MSETQGREATDDTAGTFNALEGYWQALQKGSDASQSWRRDNPVMDDELQQDLQTLDSLHHAVELLRQDSVATGVDATQRTPAPRSLLAPGTMIEQCRIEHLLGVGGMGEVYLAKHQVLGCKVAVKVMQRQLEAADFLDRFRKEIRALAHVTPHPHITAAMHASRYDNRLYLVTEFVEGVDLQKLIQRRGTLPAGQACEYIRQAAVGLAHAHQRGVVHRDIKPSNLMRTGDGQIKILDMGLASIHDSGAAGSVAMTQAGLLLGTLDYISPEQIEASSRADARSDLYSLGCTFYFLLAGRPPYADLSPLQKISAHTCRQPESLANVGKDIPASVIAVVERLMATRPENRYASADQLVAALEELHGETAAGETPLVKPTANSNRRDSSDRPWIWVGAACLAFALVVTAAVLWSRSGGVKGEAASDGKKELATSVVEQVVPVQVPLYQRPPRLLNPTVVIESTVDSVSDRWPLATFENQRATLVYLRPTDSLTIRGDFEDDVHWYLLGTQGQDGMELVAHGSAVKRLQAGDAVLPADQNDSSSWKTLLLVAGSIPVDQSHRWLEQQFHDVQGPLDLLAVGLTSGSSESTSSHGQDSDKESTESLAPRGRPLLDLAISRANDRFKQLRARAVEEVLRAPSVVPTASDVRWAPGYPLIDNGLPEGLYCVSVLGIRVVTD